MRRHLAVAPVTDPVDAAIIDAGHITTHGPVHHLHHPERIRAFCWRWRITDEAPSPRTELACGWAWTKRRAWKRRDRAYLRLLGGAR